MGPREREYVKEERNMEGNVGTREEEKEKGREKWGSVKENKCIRSGCRGLRGTFGGNGGLQVDMRQRQGQQGADEIQQSARMVDRTVSRRQ